MGPKSIVSLLLLTVLAACGGGERPQTVVLVVVDTLRADRLGMYGGPSDTAPFLSALAERSLVFGAAWAPSSWTGPSMASIFTSMYPNQHGVVLGLRGVREPQELFTLAV